MAGAKRSRLDAYITYQTAAKLPSHHHHHHDVEEGGGRKTFQVHNAVVLLHLALTAYHGHDHQAEAHIPGASLPPEIIPKFWRRDFCRVGRQCREKLERIALARDVCLNPVGDNKFVSTSRVKAARHVTSVAVSRRGASRSIEEHRGGLGMGLGEKREKATSTTTTMLNNHKEGGSEGEPIGEISHGSKTR